MRSVVTYQISTKLVKWTKGHKTMVVATLHPLLWGVPKVGLMCLVCVNVKVALQPAVVGEGITSDASAA